MGFEEDDFVADFFEKEVYFIGENNKKFFLTEGNRPEYDIIIEKNDNTKVYYEVKAQKNLIIELAEFKKGSNKKTPSGISQSLADYYLFFHTNESSNELAPKIKSGVDIYYDLYKINKDEIMKIIKAGRLVSKYSQLNNTPENIPDKNGKYLKNTGWGYTFNTEVLKKFKKESKVLAVPFKIKEKMDKDLKIRVPNYGYTKYIQSPIIEKPKNMLDKFIDTTLNEPELFYPENINNDIVESTIGTNEYTVDNEWYLHQLGDPSQVDYGYGKYYSSSESSSSSSSEGEETSLKVYNRLKRNIDKKYKIKKEKYL